MAHSALPNASRLQYVRAVHIPDGFINAPTSVAAAGVAVAGVAVCLRGARRELDERTAPMAGLVAAFVFALQMLNFPVAVGTSGHLLGGTLAAILVGPYTGALCVSVVLLVQGFLFADGGLSALGLNIVVMAFTTAAVGWGAHKLVLAFLPKRDSSLPPAAFVGALVSVPAAAVVFCGFYAVGGETRVPFWTVFGAMVGVHLLIGIGEGLITAVAVSAVLATRRDLVFAARNLQSPAAAARARAAHAADSPAQPPGRAGGPRRIGLFGAGGLLIALALAGGLSFYASSHPDGLEKVAGDQGFNAQERDSAASDSPLADYSTKNVDNSRLSVGIAGSIGVVATLGIGTGIFVAVRQRRAADSPPPQTPAAVG